MLSNDNYKFIPAEMKEQCRWMCFKILDGKKMPVSVHNGKVASVTDSTNWADYSTALEYLKNHKSNVSNLGYVFADGDNMIGIDLDDCLDESGEPINEQVKELVERTNTYVERSVSGTGLHFYVSGKLNSETGLKLSTELSPHGFGIEVYEKARCFVVTGDSYRQKEKEAVIADQSFIDYVVSLIPVRNNQHHTFDTDTINPEDVEISEELKARLDERLNTNKHFKSLWDGNRLKGNESSDDMALIYQLCQITTEEPEIISLFFSSEHYKMKDEKHKQKCNRVDYLPRTINAALTFISSNLTEEESAYAYLLEYEDNDYGNGEKFAAMYGDKLRYCESEKQWYHYDGIYWERAPMSLLNNMARELQRHFTVLANATQDTHRIKAAKALGNNDKLTNMIKAASNMMVIDVTDFNQHNHLLAVANGVVDLRTGEMIEPLPEYYITVKAPIPFNANAKSPERFCRFISEICCGRTELIQYLLVALGYCITGENREQIYFIFYGKGANGKSVLINILRYVLGDTLTGQVAQDAFVRKSNGSSLNPSLVRIKDTRLAFVSEGNSKQEMDEALLKGLSGGDIVPLRTLFKEHNYNKTHFKIILASNHMPAMRYQDESIQRRTKIIRFDNTFTGDKRDNNLDTALQNEAEGILKGLIITAGVYYKYGLSKYEPSCVAEAYNTCRAETDSVFAFVQEHAVRPENPNTFIRSSVLYQHYQRYCADNDMEAVTHKAFTTSMNRLGYESAIRTADRVSCFLNTDYNNNEELNNAS